MKKWLILAAVVAMFAMVFPACGNKDDGGDPVATDIEVTLLNDDTILVKWVGVAGYDFFVYAQKNDGAVDLSKSVKGQTIELNEVTVAEGGNRNNKASNSAKTTLNPVDGGEKTQWSIILDNTALGSSGLNLSDGQGYRFGVGAGNPGGYALQKSIIIWDFETVSDDDGPTWKDNGFIEVTVS